jgi:2-methylisocitrate lyase-like PEP mutase family enzyme
VNIEDSRAPGGPLLDPAEQAERIQAARAASASAGLPKLFINTRTDVFLYGIGVPQARLDDVLARCSAYAKAGADGLFVPGLTDLQAITELAKASPLPVNVMAGPGAPVVAELAAAGVRRVSIGTAIAQAAYTLAKRAATKVLTTGSYAELEEALDFSAINSLFAPPIVRPRLQRTPTIDGQLAGKSSRRYRVTTQTAPVPDGSPPAPR